MSNNTEAMTKPLEAMIDSARQLSSLMVERFSMNPISAKILNEAWLKEFPDEVAIAGRLNALIAALEQAQSRLHDVSVACAEAEMKLTIREEYYEGVISEGGKRIAELETIKMAAEKLVRCKGRYHSEQNYRALAALFGVITPDLPPLNSEVGGLVVKLPEVLMPARHNSGELFMSPDNVEQGGYLNRDDVLGILRAAGVKIEGDL